MIAVGDRVSFKSTPGTVRFVGTTDFSSGVWCGVELDDAHGKNDGSVQGVRYFECEDLHGIFVREPMLEALDSKPISDHKVRRQSNAGMNRSTSRLGSRSVSRQSMGGGANGARSVSRQSTSGGIRSVSRQSMGEGVRRVSGDTLAPTPSETSMAETDETSDTIKLKTIVTKLQDKLQIMHAEIGSLKSTIKVLSEEKTSTVAKTSKLEEDLEVIAIDKETLEEHNEILRQEIEVLKNKNEELQLELDTLREEVQLSGEAGTSRELEERNEMLQQALLKLRDHADDLQEQLERAVIEANDKKTVPKEVLQAQKDTEKKLLDAEKKVKELEELRREEADLEKLHLDTEHELQEEIKSLETIIGEKQEVIVSLEQKNHELGTVLDKMKRQNEREVTFDFKKFEEYRMTSTSLLREKRALKLEFKLLNHEVEMREGILKYAPDLKRHRHTAELRKYAHIFNTLSEFTETTSGDLFLDILAISLRLKMLSMAVFLEYCADVHEQCGVAINVQDLSVCVEEYVHHIKEEEYKNVPDLKQIQDEMASVVENAVCDFHNRFKLQFKSKQQKTSLQITQEVISRINTSKIKSNYDQFPDITKLYQLTLSRMELVDDVLVRIQKEVDGSNDVSLFDITPLVDDVQKFIDEILSKLSSLDFDSGRVDLSKEFNQFLSVLDSLPSNKPEWETVHVTPSSNPTVIEGSKELQTHIATLKSDLAKKSTLLDESTSKIQILQSRLEHLHQTEAMVKKYRSELETITSTNLALDKRVGELSEQNEKLSAELHRARNNNLIHNSQFETLLEQKQYTEKASLISEIETLQRAVRHFSAKNKRSLDMSWLRKEIPVFKPYAREAGPSDELRNISRDLQRAVERSSSYLIR